MGVVRRKKAARALPEPGLGVTAEIRTQNLFLYFSVYVNHTNKSP
jgi:hypothetical protein